MSTYKDVNIVHDILMNMKLHSGLPLVEVIGNKVLNEIVLNLASSMPLNNQERVTEFNDTFKVKREEDFNVSSFKTANLRIRLILEEVIELGFALGYTKYDLYELYNQLSTKVYGQPPFIDNGEKLTEVFDALIDTLYVVYGALDAFNLAPFTEAGMKEVHSSNMSKVCTDLEVLEATVGKYKLDGIELITEKDDKGVYIVKDRHTEKVLKSLAYAPANLKQILINNKII
tara:strand:- start:32248 stop:32937 length:690 start_codon:yes stop_codon:yes gene_type:complete